MNSSKDGARADDPLLASFKLKDLELRNRIMSTSHACGLQEGGYPRERYQRYHEEKAKGGIALTMFGGSSNVAPDSPSVFDQLYVGDDRVIPHLRRLSHRVHRHGAALMCQITHLGRRGSPWAGNWLPTIGPSPIRETLHRSFPKEMETSDITRVIQAYGEAGLRCHEGGLDGIEAMGCAHLIGQFLSPLTNQRIDAFGGSVENRCRFGLLVFEEIRRRVGDDFIVGFRFTIDENTPGGLDFEQSLEIAKIFESSGLIDFFNVNFGSMDTLRAIYDENMPGMDMPSAPWLEAAGRFKQDIRLPVFHAAKISDAATARYAIRAGLLDMVAMTRAHIADPHIVNKLMNGEEDSIRPCVGATHCMSDNRPTCIHNPAAGREMIHGHQIKKARSPGLRVVIVGAGPAGLEAGLVSAERGHDVTIFEATDRIGGQVNLASRNDNRRDLLEIVQWRMRMLERHGVRVELNAYIESSEVLDLSPQIVIVATGGLPIIESTPGGDLATTAWDVIGGNVPISGKVLVVDGTGRHAAPLAALCLRDQGCTVEIVTIDGELAREVSSSERNSLKRQCYESGIAVYPDHGLLQIVRDGNYRTAVLRNETNRSETRMSADHIVVDLGTFPCEEVYRNLVAQSSNQGVTHIDTLIAGRRQPHRHEPGGFQLYRVGDAISSRNIASAIYDSFRLCRTL